MDANEKFTIKPEAIEAGLRRAQDITDHIEKLKDLLKSESTFAQYWSLECLWAMHRALDNHQENKDILRFGVLMGLGIVEPCESSKQYIPEHGFVNNGIGCGEQPSCEHEAERLNKTDDDVPPELKAAVGALDSIFKAIGIPYESRIERVRKKQASKETPDFVKDMLAKIESGELS